MTKQEKIKKALEVLQGDNKAEILKDLIQMINDGVSRDELLELIKKILEKVSLIESKVVSMALEAISELKGENNASLQATQADLRRFQAELAQSINSSLNEQETAIKAITEKVMTIKPGEPGKDADEEKIVKEVLMVISKEMDEFKKLIEEMKEWKLWFEEIRTQRTMFGGGKVLAPGTNRAAVEYFDLTDQCNGVTKTFTIPQNRRIIGVFSTQFPINYRPVVDWTGSGTTTLTLTSEVGAPQTGQTLYILYVNAK